MANKYIINDVGDVIYYNGEVWTKTGTSTANLPNASMGVGDVGNIVGYTFNTADPQGRTVYTDDEMGVSYYKIGQSDVSWSGTEKQTFFASAPYSGVFRWWQDYSANVTLYINGVAITNQTITSKAAAYPVNVEAGDLIESNLPGGGPTTGHGLLIPFSYTNPG